MNIPLLYIGLKELESIECKPYSHFFILCDCITTILATINILIEEKFTDNRDELVCDAILKENYNNEKAFFK